MPKVLVDRGDLEAIADDLDQGEVTGPYGQICVLLAQPDVQDSPPPYEPTDSVVVKRAALETLGAFLNGLPMAGSNIDPWRRKVHIWLTTPTPPAPAPDYVTREELRRILADVKGCHFTAEEKA